MPVSDAGRRRRLRRPVPIISELSGLPAIGPKTLVVLAPDGVRVYVGEGRWLAVFEIDHRLGQARLANSLDLAGVLASLDVAPDGTAYAWVVNYAAGGASSTVVGVVRQGRVVELADLPTRVGSTAATRSSLAAVVPASALEPPRLVLLDRHNGKLVTNERLGSGRTTITAGRKDELLIADPSEAGRVRWVDTGVDTERRAERCRPDEGSAGGPTSQPGPGECVMPKDPCPRCCPPPRRPRRREPSQPRPGPAGGRGDRCVPGGSGVPDDCIVTTVQDSWAISVNVCAPDPVPCSVHLDFPIGTVQRTARAVVATSIDGQRLAVLDADSLRLLYEHRPTSGVFRTMTARAAETVMLVFDTGTVVALDPTPVLPALDLDLVNAATPVVFDGQPDTVNWQHGGIQTGTYYVMLVPVLEAGQAFHGDIDSYFAIADLQAALEDVPAFFREVSYNQPPDVVGFNVVFRIFGVDTPLLYSGPPVQIGKVFADYWNDGWQPGGIESTAAIPPGSVLQFSGDEQLVLRTFPEIVDPRTFTIGFPVASFSVRVPESATGYTLEFGPTASPARVLALKGTDRNGDPVNIVATTASWSQPTLQITVDRDTTLANGAATADIASALEALLDTVPGHPFAPPEVRWLDDGEEWGLLHVGLFYAPAAGGEEPSVTAFDADSVFLEFSPGADASLAASFSLPGTEDALADYLGRILADATVDEFAQSNIQQSHFDYRIRPPEVTIDGSDLSVRINLAPEHGRTVDAENPARIERVAQTGLVKIGMDTPTVKNGGTTKLSGSGDPTLEHGEELFSDVFTAMVDASIAYQDGPEEDRIDRLNSFFNCEDLSAIECTFNFIHNFVVVPVNRCPAGNPNGADREPAVEGLRGNTSGDKMVDSGSRAKPVTTIAGNRRKIFASLRLPTASSPERHLRDAGTLAHELGHGILGYRDQYSADVDRRDLRYCGDYDLMANSAARVHMSSYHKRISGWLDDDAIMVLDRPEDGSPIDREIVLVQLEAWDPTLGAEAYSVLAHSLMPGTPYGAPAVTAAFLRLGGDAHSYDILELRGPGERFSKNIPTPRVIAINAVDPRDQTRYGEVAEDAEIAEDALLRYRRQIHLLDDSLSTAGDTVDLGDLPKLAEAGLRISLQELTSASTGPFTFHLARVRIQWERGRAIDLAFRKSLPDWQSPDIAIIKPEDIPEDGTPEFPQHQPPDILETFRVPASGEGDLQHKILARVWNQGDADAFNVQVELVEKLPGGGGDWRSESVIGSQLIDGTIGSGDNGIVSFNWNVSSGLDTHVCFRAQVGDRDPEPGASDDTTIENNWAQQNVFVYEASADSPPRPVDFTYSVTNNGPYTEEVRLFPKGMGVGSRLTITPRKMYIRAYSRGVFRVAPSSTNACLPPAAARTSPFCSRRCASTITFTNRGAPPSTRSSPASRRPPHSKAM